MPVSNITESKYFKAAAIVTGVLLVALFSFAVGVRVGLHQAFFSERFGANYERNFLGGPEWRGDPMTDPLNRGMRNPHGAGGEIISIAGDTLVIKDRNNQENPIQIGERTSINRGRETLAPGGLAVGDRIIVIGKPGDDGVIVAELIRVFDIAR
jgi:hypothetical protein